MPAINFMTKEKYPAKNTSLKGLKANSIFIKIVFYGLFAL